jgi:hypothetical protein
MPCSHCGHALNKSLWNGVYKSCPNCSRNGPEHIFYPIDSHFGDTPRRVTSRNPDGDQSWCEVCRGGNPAPRNGTPCSSLAGTPKTHGP